MEICPKKTRTELRDVCRTRWIERIEALEVFEKLYIPIVSALEKIKNNFDDSWSSEHVTEANGLWATCIQFEFIIGLVVNRKGMSYIKPATVKLQSKETDIAKAYGLINIVL